MARPIIHNAGSLNIDDVFQTAHIVRPGETISSRTLTAHAGGKGLNQSTALARAGISVRHIARIGQDGLFLKDRLKDDGVDVSGIVEGGTPTGRAIIQVADDGENAIVLFGGANQNWNNSDISRLLDGAAPKDILLLQNEVNMVPELISAAADAGLRIAFNPAPMNPEVKDFPLHRISWLIVNEIEGCELAGINSPPSSQENTDNTDAKIVEGLRTLYPDTVVVLTLGKRGAIRADGTKTIHASFPDQGKVVDTTGAGDTFIGYFLAAEAEGLDAESGLRRACAAGALAVTKSGAAESIPWKSDVEKIL